MTDPWSPPDDPWAAPPPDRRTGRSRPPAPPAPPLPPVPRPPQPQPQWQAGPPTSPPTAPWPAAPPQWQPGPAPGGAPAAAWGAPYVGDDAVPFDVVRWLRESTFALVAPFLGVLLLGAPIGLLWVWLTPDVPVVEVDGVLQYAAPETKAFFAVEGWFLVISLLAGVLAGAIAWRALRRRGPAVPLGLAMGSLIAAQVAREVGGRVVVDGRVHAFCTAQAGGCSIYDGTLQLRATAVLLALAFASLLTHLLLTAIFDRGDTARPVWDPPPADAVPII